MPKRELQCNNHNSKLPARPELSEELLLVTRLTVVMRNLKLCVLLQLSVFRLHIYSRHKLFMLRHLWLRHLRNTQRPCRHQHKALKLLGRLELPPSNALKLLT